ncbi:MAG: helix-turn-helix domain-containing protein [Acidiferrobacterales bacterium]|nr:helix-turn-helix domain-containing protein [Acidiferrobacterales bacterium]
MRKPALNILASTQIENELGRQIESIRLSRNITQSQLADAAGVSRSTISRLAKENAGISLDSFIRILQALDLTEQLETLLPDPEIRPLQQLSKKSYSRQRARQSGSGTSQSEESWTWGDIGDDQ